MKINIELNGVATWRDMPTSWADVTFGQFLRLEACGNDPAKIFELFLGIEADVIRKAKIHGLDQIMLKIKFLQEQPPMDLPTAVLGHPIPKDLGLESLGQYIDLRQDVDNGAKRTPREALERYPVYLATYACKPYDWQDAEAMAPKFLDAPASEVLAVGHFTLLKLIGLSVPTPKSSQNLRTRLKSFRQGLRIWVRNTGIMARYYIWRLKPGRAGVK